MAYRLLLNREPESSEVVEELLEGLSTYKEVRSAFVSCPEYRRRYPTALDEINRVYWKPPPNVTVDVSKPVLAKLLNRLSDQWKKLGESDPYWSVLTHDDFRMQGMDADKLEEFYETGRVSAGIIELFEKKTETTVGRGVCLELGCGVGRITAHLAEKFERVIAVDISPGNLAICKQYMEQLGLDNVETVLLESPNQLSTLGDFDFFYSVIVLQHNPPPIQKALLENVLKNIRKGGGCLFQTCGSLRDYSFSPEEYLQTKEQVMDIHCLPKPVVLRLLHKNRLQVRDVEMDPWVDAFGSYTYFATK
jgi:SAM-dependent methyltransferase